MKRAEENRVGRDWIGMGLALALAGFGVAFQVRMAGATPEWGDLAGVGVGMAAGAGAFWLAGGGRAGKVLRSGWGKWGAAAAAGLVMAALLAFGRRYRGGLYLPGLVNPSEPVKLCWVAFTAAFWGSGAGVGRAAAYCGAAGALAGLVALAGDYGMLLQLGLTGAAMVWAASWGWGILAAAGVAAGTWAAGAVEFTGHLAKRMAVWRDPFSDVTGAGWQTLQAMAAVVGGGVWGSGWGQGAVERVPIASSDFVYAAVAADWGWAGCAALIGAWGTLLGRMFWRAGRLWGDDREEALLAAGVGASLAVQLTLNAAGVLNAAPMTGITLPLVSHGGSSAAATLAACGLACGLCGRRR